jgi:hypothetical protein
MIITIIIIIILKEEGYEEADDVEITKANGYPFPGATFAFFLS